MAAVFFSGCVCAPGSLFQSRRFSNVEVEDDGLEVETEERLFVATASLELHDGLTDAKRIKILLVTPEI